MNASTGRTIRLNTNLDNSVPIDKELTIELNGNDIINNEKTSIHIKVCRNLTVKGQGTIECNKNNNAAVFNNGNITINNGKLQRTTDVSGNGYYTAVNHGTMTINGGMFMSGGEFSSMIENGYWDYNAGNTTNGYIQG